MTSVNLYKNSGPTGPERVGEIRNRIDTPCAFKGNRRLNGAWRFDNQIQVILARWLSTVVNKQTTAKARY
jgi:hypothetical protein